METTGMYNEISKTVEQKMIEIDTSLKDRYQISKQLDQELPIDSLDTMTLLLDLEEEFGIKITETDFETYQLNKTSNLVKFIENKVKSNS